MFSIAQTKHDPEEPTQLSAAQNAQVCEVRYHRSPDLEADTWRPLVMPDEHHRNESRWACKFFVYFGQEVLATGLGVMKPVLFSSSHVDI